MNGHLYGHADGNHKWRHWACLELETGITMYSVAGLPAKASETLTYADGMLYLLGEPGNVALMPADPDSFDITSQFQLPEGVRDPSGLIRLCAVDASTSGTEISSMPMTSVQKRPLTEEQ